MQYVLPYSITPLKENGTYVVLYIYYTINIRHKEVDFLL